MSSTLVTRLRRELFEVLAPLADLLTGPAARGFPGFEGRALTRDLAPAATEGAGHDGGRRNVVPKAGLVSAASASRAGHE